MKFSSLKYLDKYLYKYRVRLLSGVVFIAISNYLSIFPAQIFRNVIDVVLESVSLLQIFKGSSLESEVEDTLISASILFGAGLFVFALSRGFFVFLMRQTIIMMSRFIEYDLKNEIYEKYQELDISFYKRNNTGDIMNRISEDVSKVRMYLGPAIMYTINLVVLFSLVIGFMISISGKLTLYVLSPLPILTILIYFVSRKINIKSEKVQKQLSTIFNITQETFSGIRVVKAYTKEERTKKEFDAEAEKYKNDALDLAMTESMFHPLITFLPVLSTIITVFVGGLEVIAGNITYGNIAEFVIYINLLTWPVASLGWVTSLLQRAEASQERINQFLKEESKIKNPNKDNLILKGKIEFRNVSFTYPESGITALRNVSFTLEPGKSIAVVGKTGSGKSTIAHLINRMYDPTEGEILIDDKPLKSLNLNEIRKQIGVVPQEVFLFSETIANNIAFGSIDSVELSEQDNIAIEQAAKKASIHQNIVDFKMGYKTLVGERGVTLSGGQKQRISIARALLKSPQILILDDCLSAVDTETEEAILQSLKADMRHRSNLIISHRISSIKHCDSILLVENGRIIEQGNHDELIAKQKEYFELHEKQLKEVKPLD